jgi:hypothetical protein
LVFRFLNCLFILEGTIRITLYKHKIDNTPLILTTTELCEKDITDVVSNACEDEGGGTSSLNGVCFNRMGCTFKNEQLISFFVSQSFDCAYSTAKPLPLGYPKKKGLVWLLVIEKCVTIVGCVAF